MVWLAPVPPVPRTETGCRRRDAPHVCVPRMNTALRGLQLLCSGLDLLLQSVITELQQEMPGPPRKFEINLGFAICTKI